MRILPASEGLFNSVRDPLEFIPRKELLRSIIDAGDWLLTTIRAAAQDGMGAGYRDIIFYRDKSYRWLYPHSNMGEQIDTLLSIWEVSGEKRFYEGAITYAERMLADGERGLYQGPIEEAHGLVYYWRNVGGYTGMYSMRAIAPFYRLYQITGEQRYLDTARQIADPLLRAFHEGGISPYFAWTPEEGFVLKNKDSRIGSRAGMLVGIYAFCANILEDARALEGLERLQKTLKRVQNPDGSFPQDFTLAGEPGDLSIKNHFHGYLLNGLIQCLQFFPDNAEILEITHRLVDFSVSQVRYFSHTPYCASADNPHTTDQAALFFPVADPAPGLIRFARQQNRPDALTAAKQIIVQHFFRQIDSPDFPEAHGGFITTNDPCVKPDPVLSTYGGVGVPHLEENPERVGTIGIYNVNQYIQAAHLLL